MLLQYMNQKEKNLEKNCPICNCPLDSSINPHFHVIDGKIICSRKAWIKKVEKLVQEEVDDIYSRNRCES